MSTGTSRLVEAVKLLPQDLISVRDVNYRVVDISTSHTPGRLYVRTVRQGDSAAHVTGFYFDRSEQVAVVEEAAV